MWATFILFFHFILLHLHFWAIFTFHPLLNCAQALWSLSSCLHCDSGVGVSKVSHIERHTIIYQRTQFRCSFRFSSLYVYVFVSACVHFWRPAEKWPLCDIGLSLKFLSLWNKHYKNFKCRRMLNDIHRIDLFVNSYLFSHYFLLYSASFLHYFFIFFYNFEVQSLERLNIYRFNGESFSEKNCSTNQNKFFFHRKF